MHIASCNSFLSQLINSQFKACNHMIHFFMYKMQLPLSFLCVQCFIVVVLLKTWPSLALTKSDPEFYDGCRIPFRCGDIKVGYPFWGGDRPLSCGHPSLQLKCDSDYETRATITIQDVNYYVQKIDERSQTLKIVRQDYYDYGICSSDSYPKLQFIDTTIDDFFNYSAGYEDLTVLYGCPATHPGRLDCPFSFAYMDVFAQAGANFSDQECNTSIIVPASTNITQAAKGNSSILEEAISQGFELKWNLSNKECDDCRNSSGSCGFYADGFVCYCPILPYYLSASVCANSSKSLQPLPPSSTGSTTGVLVGILIILSIFFISGVGRMFIWDENYLKRKEHMQNMEVFVRNFGSFVPQRFEYSDVKKMTNSFTNRLGQGGYGDVYQGKLADGRLVAVKILKESKGNGEEFINEVASISRTSHVNIVTLLGFCYTMNKRALIYEFMPNGSLEKFIYDKGSSSANHILEWKTRYQIAIGIARGLEYLHKGCNTRIVHFDIKPHNILLDEEFRPKISDFGLAKLCKGKESIISMLGARGTAGYIAPEVFCRTFGEVSHKSDVYSYGMMVLEMVGGRKNIDAIDSHTSEIYFPNWIYKQLEPDKDFEFDGVVTEDEKEIAKKMIIAGMWCIQTIPSDRPSMSKVVEMLEGSLESLQIPPKPSLSLPARSPKNSVPLTLSSTSTFLHRPASHGEVCIELSDM